MNRAFREPPRLFCPIASAATRQKEVSTLANIFRQVKKNSPGKCQYGREKGMVVAPVKKMTIIGMSYAKIANLFNKG